MNNIIYIMLFATVSHLYDEVAFFKVLKTICYMPITFRNFMD